EELEALEKETEGKYGMYGAGNAPSEETLDEDDMLENESEAVADSFEEEGESEESAPKKSAKKSKKKDAKPVSITITVNDETVVLNGKASYTFVDILDVYPFDLSAMGGSSLATTLNGINVDFTNPINEGDVAKIYWND
ncbi:MAG: hypothetical protein II699_04095, partial [Lachnospiraceae bacterium]|nr:hypothetical protein [Lachnospiraceae bacterium]